MTNRKKMDTNISRRKFLRNTGCASLGMTAFYSSIFNLKAMNAASIFNSSVSAGGNYKALICLFMSGGNDSFNMIIPRGNSEYQEYLTTRSSTIAVAQDQILGIDTNNQGGKSLGVHPVMPRMKQLYDSGKLTFISNIGTLVEPVTSKENLWNGATKLPLGLFSHSDQIMHWQTSVPQDRVAIGWGGKVADLIGSANTNQSISMNISLSGSNIFQTGNSTVEYAIDPYFGSRGIMGYDAPDWIVEQTRKQGIDNLIDAHYHDMFKKSFIDVIKTSRDGQEQLQSALDSIPDFDTQFSDTRVSQSFHMAAKTIATRQQLGMSRQVFFIDMGGWDHHDNFDAYAEMMSEVDNALFEFDSAISELAARENSEIDKCVTTFSVSEFGRTLTSNGNGTDHGWGGNIFVMGGDVKGGKIIGTYPSLELDGPKEIGGGVLIPDISADEYFAELALWFGVPASELATIFPNIGNFYSGGSGSTPLDFLNI